MSTTLAKDHGGGICPAGWSGMFPDSSTARGWQQGPGPASGDGPADGIGDRLRMVGHVEARHGAARPPAPEPDSPPPICASVRS